MYEFLRGNRDFVSKVSTVLKGTAVAALVAGLSLPAFGQATGGTGGVTNPLIPGPTATTGTTGTSTGPSALFCTVPTVLPPGTTTATSTSSTTAIPTVTGSLIPNNPGTTLSCGAFGGTQNLQNLAFTAEGVIPLDFVLANVAPTLPVGVFTSLATGTQELRDVVTLMGNSLVIDFFTVPSTSTFPTAASSITGGALTVTPSGSLLTELTIQVANVIVTDGNNPSILFSGVVTQNTTTVTTGTTGATGVTTTTGGTTATTAGSVGIGNTSGGTSTGVTATAGAGMATGIGLVPNLFGNQVGRAAAVSLAFNSPILFPGLGTTPVVTGATAFGPTASSATMLGVMVAGGFTLASPVTNVTFNTPLTPAAFQTTTAAGTTSGATIGTITGGTITGGTTGGGITTGTGGGI